MEQYNRYNESLNIDCGCGNTTPKVKKVKDDYCYIDEIFCYKN